MPSGAPQHRGSVQPWHAGSDLAATLRDVDWQSKYAACQYYWYSLAYWALVLRSTSSILRNMYAAATAME